MARDPAIQDHVRQLEEDYDSTLDEAPRARRDEALNTEQLMRELEDFLREEREDEDEG